MYAIRSYYAKWEGGGRVDLSRPETAWDPADYARWLAPTALFVAALAIRALPWRTVFVGDTVLLFDHDAYYHLRRIVWSVVHFPRVLDFDSYLNFPEGARAIWTPCFDWLVALLALPFAEPRQLASIERVAVWAPPLLVITSYSIHYTKLYELLAHSLDQLEQRLAQQRGGVDVRRRDQLIEVVVVVGAAAAVTGARRSR